MIDFETLKTFLGGKLSQANYAIDSAVQHQLTEYLLLLAKWNQAYNLTSVRDVREMVTQHIVDSLSVASFVHGKRILDIGTGAGLPGIPLALQMPEREFVLLDSNGKKTRFLTHVIQTLKIKNVTVVQARAEAFKPEVCFDSVITRAFSSLAEFLEKTQSLCCSDGLFLAMKGNYPTEELVEISEQFNVVAVHPLQVAGLDAQRHLVVIQHQNH